MGQQERRLYRPGERRHRRSLQGQKIARLPRYYRDHPLKNNWSGYRDAHIEPDWVVIYCIIGDVVRFERTGTHADLFE
ncbi:MAG: type II toxin-antitoxin system YafQ family toxin [Acidobacteriaceae bacterium]